MKKLMLTMLFIMLLVGCAPHTKEDGLEEALKNQRTNMNVDLREITPFEWEKVYFIAPYLEKEAIEECIGVKDLSIKENMVDEGVLSMIFINKGKCVYQVIGKVSKLGFDFKIPMYKKVFEIQSEKANFRVKDTGEEMLYILQ